jgi:hypothetical protein
MKTKLKMLTTSVLAAVLLGVMAVALPGYAAPAFGSGPPENLYFQHTRNTRYCEIFLMNNVAGGGVQAYVYNTTGEDNCPTQQWDALNPQQLAKEFNVDSVFLNGQRFWLPDQVAVENVKETLDFGGVEARYWGQASINPFPSPSYTPNTINRSAQWFFSAGKLIFELIDPTGQTYVMQSYSTIVDKNLKYDDLLSLGSQLQLPTGWKYQIQILTQNLSVSSIPSGVAHILQDNLQNSYNLVTAGSIQAKPYHR